MPQIRICANCKKILQVDEAHKCSRPASRSEFVTCDKCGHKYRVGQWHICPTMVK